MYIVDLCHFGDQCAPGIIIDDILKQQIKTLFMLGLYSFNNILSYLKDGNYENIYNEENLIIQPDKYVIHRLYNFGFNHEYTVGNSKINNYAFVRDRFNIKIFKEMLLSENMCIFISFTHNVNALKLNDMLSWLTINKKNFHLMIFTNKKHNVIYDPRQCSIITLKNSYDSWYAMKTEPKMILYKEIYEEFIDCLKKCDIKHNFPMTY